MFAHKALGQNKKPFRKVQNTRRRDCRRLRLSFRVALLASCASSRPQQLTCILSGSLSLRASRSQALTWYVVRYCFLSRAVRSSSLLRYPFIVVPPIVFVAQEPCCTSAVPLLCPLTNIKEALRSSNTDHTRRANHILCLVYLTCIGYSWHVPGSLYGLRPGPQHAKYIKRIICSYLFVSMADLCMKIFSDIKVSGLLILPQHSTRHKRAHVGPHVGRGPSIEATRVDTKKLYSFTI